MKDASRNEPETMDNKAKMLDLLNNHSKPVL